MTRAGLGRLALAGLALLLSDGRATVRADQHDAAAARSALERAQQATRAAEAEVRAAAAAVKSALDRIQAATRIVEAQVRAAVVKAKAITPGTPLAEREAIARELLDLRERLRRLRAEADAERQRIGALPDVDGVVVVADVVGLSVPQAEKALRDQGLVPLTQGGRSTAQGCCAERAGVSRQGVNTCPPRQVPCAWLEPGGGAAAGPAPTGGGTVDSQVPAAGAQIRKGGTVTLAARAPLPDPTRAVPDVRGRRYAEADAALRQAGFAVAAEGGAAPPSKTQEHTVEAHTPGAGSAQLPGSTVTLRIYASYVEPTRAVPDVTGRRYAEAEAALRQAGFTVAAEGGGAPATKGQEHTVEAQTPGPGTARLPGTTVTLRIYAAYVEPSPVGRVPGPEAGGGGTGAERPVEPLGPATSLGCPQIAGVRRVVSRVGKRGSSEEMVCFVEGSPYFEVMFNWTTPGSGQPFACGRGLPVTWSASPGWRVVVDVPSQARSAGFKIWSQHRQPPSEAMVAAMARVLAEQIEPRAAPCGGAPAPTQAQPAVPPRPPAPGRGGSTGPPGNIRTPWVDPCPGGSASPLGQSCN